MSKRPTGKPAVSKRKIVPVSIRPDQADDLRRIADRERRPVAFMIREAIDAYVADDTAKRNNKEG